MRNFLNVADNALRHFIDSTEFDASIVHHLLFQDDVLIDESYLGDSPLVFNHVLRAREQGQDSLFLSAIEQGIFLPAFRTLSNDPVGSWLERMEQFYGTEYPLLKPQHRTLRHLFTTSLKKGGDGHSPVAWPVEHGTSREQIFLEELRARLQRTTQPGPTEGDSERVDAVAGGLSGLWNVTEPWRYDLVERAAQVTRDKGRSGVARTEIVNELGRQFGVAPTGDGSQTDLIFESTGITSPAAAFFKWVTQCHHIAQARFFATAIHFPVYNLSTDFVAQDLLQHPQPAEPDSTHRRLHCDIQLPPAQKLALVQPATLIDIRQRFGAAYFEAVDEWAIHPSERTALSVKQTLNEYASQLNRLLTPQSLYRIVLAREAPRDILSEDVANVADALGSVEGVPGGSYVKVVRSVYQSIRWYSARRQYLPKIQTIDVTLPELP